MRTALHVEHGRDAEGRTRYVVRLVGGVTLVLVGGVEHLRGVRNDDARAPARPRASWPALAGGSLRN